MKPQEPISLFTNIVFLPPLLLAITKDYFVYATILTLAVIVSIFYHYLKPVGSIKWIHTPHQKINLKILFWSDAILVVVLILFNLFIFWAKGFPIEFWYAALLGVLALFLIFFKNMKQKYDAYHGLWHFLSGIIILLAVIA